MEEEIKTDFENVFMMYLPRICEHCMNPSCVSSCPSGAMYKREEDGIVLVDQMHVVLGDSAYHLVHIKKCILTGKRIKLKNVQCVSHVLRLVCQQFVQKHV